MKQREAWFNKNIFSKFVLRMFNDFEKYRIRNDLLNQKLDVLDYREQLEKRPSLLSAIQKIPGVGSFVRKFVRRVT